MYILTSCYSYHLTMSLLSLYYIHITYYLIFICLLLCFLAVSYLILFAYPAETSSPGKHRFQWRDLFDVFVRWRQVSEPKDVVWWIDGLPEGKVNDTFTDLATDRIVLCTLLYCNVLYCNVLYCTVLYSTALNSTLLYCTVL